MAARRRRRITGRTIIIAALVFALAGVGAFTFRSVRQANAYAEACKLLTPDELVHISGGASKVAVLGDSYSAGDTLPSRSAAWVSSFAAETGRAVDVAAVGSTGYTNGGYCGEQYFSERLDTALKAEPELLIIQGGLNDWEASADDVEVAANSLLQRTEDLPDVVLVGPPTTPMRGDSSKVDAALASAAERHGRAYISTKGWDLPMGEDGLHLTEAGHALFAAKVAASMPR